MPSKKETFSHLYRTRIARDIIAEFLPSARKLRKGDNIIILCDGLPSVPSKKSLMQFLSDRGFWVFHPRYRGTWESGGRFLRQSPVKDIYDVVEFLKKAKSITELYGNHEFDLSAHKIFVIGSSFGGAVALSASLHSDVDKALALSPVVDFAAREQGEDPLFLQEYTRRAFGHAYRGSPIGWQRLHTGQLMNPIDYIKKLDKKKIFIVHSKDDAVVSYVPVQEFCEELGCGFWLLRKRGHMSASTLSKAPRIWKKIRPFLR